MPRKPKKQASQTEASKSNFDEFVDEGDAIEDDSIPPDAELAGGSKSRDWRDVEKLQEERRLRKLIADDLDFDL
ncbi:hypothetical protein [Solimonas marina]|uniref:Uncharacterized protein n=1 Tax=Solimonas marina TaxID=2714601 RepID=A0A969W952_9GAMM|nr:hypothetical protein [Solimonas marina]NKF21829.1 hypothetical protein [Solimonas marina]